MTAVTIERVPALRELVRWFADDALPTWARSGFDEGRGQFVEALTLDGLPSPDPVIRVRSAARSVYVFADAGRLGLGGPEHLGLAETAFANLHAIAWIDGERPGYARSIDRVARRIIDPTRDLYDNACVLLALVALLAATGNPEYRGRIEQLLRAVDTTLAAPAGGWAEDDRGSLPRRQNPHMHMFESCLALATNTREAAHRRLLDAIYDLFKKNFWRGGPLREFFGPSWEVDPKFQSARLDPGHMCEWVWLLRTYSRSFGVSTEAAEEDLHSTAQRIGLAGGRLLADEVSEGGAPLKSSRRLWPQAEFIKALLSRFDATGEPRHLEAANAVAAALSGHYLSQTPRGTWRDSFDLDGNFNATSVPGSSLYHLWTAVSEIDRTLGPAGR